jgi:hypothetical protein
VPGAYLSVLDELLPAALHDVGQYANNVLEADHGRLKARQRAMRVLKTTASAQLVCSGHAFVQNLRRAITSLGSTFPGGVDSPRRSPSSPTQSGDLRDGGFTAPRMKQRNSAGLT